MARWVAWLLLVMASITQADIRSLRLVGTDWCPYTCAYRSLPGYVTEFYQQLLAPEGVRVEVSLMPWDQAVAAVQKGQFDGLITAHADPQKGLLIAESPTDYNDTCLYRLRGDDYHYRGVESLRGERLGLVQGYLYGHLLDTWLERQADPSDIVYIEDVDPLQQLLERLRRGDISMLVEDRQVFEHHLYRTRASAEVRRVSCLAHTPFYLLLRPDYPDAQVFLALFSRLQSSAAGQQLRAQVKRRYGLSD